MQATAGSAAATGVMRRARACSDFQNCSIMLSLIPSESIQAMHRTIGSRKMHDALICLGGVMSLKKMVLQVVFRTCMLISNYCAHLWTMTSSLISMKLGEKASMSTPVYVDGEHKLCSSVHRCQNNTALQTSTATNSSCSLTTLFTPFMNCSMSGALQSEQYQFLLLSF
jgi:hypothetical protein